MPRTRAWRRWRWQVAEAHARRVARIVVRYSTPAEVERWIKRGRDNLCVCSCWMCGNPRRHSGRTTRAEQRAVEPLHDQSCC